MTRPIIWSYGGGVQSVAIAVLVAQGRLPKPERAYIADTGRENPETWAYLGAHVAPMLAPLGLVIEVIPPAEPKPSLFAGDKLLLPVYGSQGGKHPPICSDRWKKRRIRQSMRRDGYGPRNPVDQWLGFSVDEAHRAKEGDVQWVRNRFPLLFDVPCRREECNRLVIEHGLPQPPKSACYICPHHRDRQWGRLRSERPDLFAEACAVDEEVRARDTMGGVFLHESRRPLSSVALAGADDEADRLFDLFALDCEGESCFT